MRNILLVDDEEINRLGVAVHLKKHLNFPYNLHQASSGYEALSLARDFRFDVVIMDYQMPWMNWWVTMYKLRRDVWWDWIWIWYTSHSAREIWQHFLDAWANKVFLKPNDIDWMLRYIVNKKYPKMILN